MKLKEKNAEKQIEKLINEIQQEEFTQLEEMKDHNYHSFHIKIAKY